MALYAEDVTEIDVYGKVIKGSNEMPDSLVDITANPASSESFSRDLSHLQNTFSGLGTYIDYNHCSDC